MTITGGIDDQAVIALSRNEIRSSGQVLSSVYIKGSCRNRFHIISRRLIPFLVPPLPRRLHVFTKDLKQFRADLETTDDEAAVIQRHRDARAAKGEVCREFLVVF